jgi:hypothetical protein
VGATRGLAAYSIDRRQGAVEKSSSSAVLRGFPRPARAL